MKMSVTCYLKYLPNALITCKVCFHSNRNGFLKLSPIFTTPIPILNGRVNLSVNSENPETFGRLRGVFGEVRESYSLIQNYYRKYLLNNPNYANSVFDRKKLFDNSGSDCKSLELLKELANREDDAPDLTNITATLEKEVKTLNFDDLLLVFGWTLICHTKVRPENTFLNLLAIIDREFCNRLTTLSVDDLLRMFDLVCVLDRTIKLSMKKKFMRLCHRKLTAPQVVHLLYIIGTILTPKNSKLNLQEQVYNNFSNFNHIELGIICRGFLSSKTNIRYSEIADLLITKVKNEVDLFNSQDLNYIFKVFKLISNPNRTSIINFFEEIIPSVDKLDVQLLSHMLLIGYHKQVIHMNYNLFEKVSRRFKDNPTECHISNIISLVSLTTVFNINDEELLNLAISSIKSCPEEKKKNAVLYLLVSLIQHGKYPEDLLKYAISEENLRIMENKRSGLSTRAWWFIYCSLELDKPEYCLELPQKLRKRLWNTFQKSVTDRIIPGLIQKDIHPVIKLRETLKDLFGETKVLFTSPLAHYSETNILIMNKDMELQEIPNDYFKTEYGMKGAKDDGNFWISFIIVKWTSIVHEKELNYIEQTKLRHFASLGYIPVVIVVSDLIMNVRNGTSESYIRNAIQNALREKGFVS